MLVVVCFPWSTSRLCPSPQSLPVETLGPESGVGPELQSAPQAPRSPHEADREELAGTSDGAGNRALPRAGRRHPPSAFWGPRRPQARAVPVHFRSPPPGFFLPLPSRRGPREPQGCVGSSLGAAVVLLGPSSHHRDHLPERERPASRRSARRGGGQGEDRHVGREGSGEGRELLTAVSAAGCPRRGRSWHGVPWPRRHSGPGRPGGDPRAC